MIDDILKDRENRYNEILNLLKNNMIAVCLKINYPGSDKNTPHSKAAFRVLKEEGLSAFAGHMFNIKKIEGFDGDSLIFNTDLQINEAKKIGIKIEENHPLGRVFDIDIYKDGGIPVSRDEFKAKIRSCIVCGKNSRECAKLKRHSIDELLKIINKRIEDFGELNGN